MVSDRRDDSAYGKKSYSMPGARPKSRSVFEKLECDASASAPKDHFGPRLLTTSAFTFHECCRLTMVSASSTSKLLRLSDRPPWMLIFHSAVTRLAENDTRKDRDWLVFSPLALPP